MRLPRTKNADLDRFRCTIYCCHSTGCKSSGSDDIISLLQDAIEEYDLKDKVRIVAAGCMGLCAQGPLMRVEIKGQKDVLYKRLEPLIARLVVAEHVVPALKLEDGETFEIPEFFAAACSVAGFAFLYEAGKSCVETGRTHGSGRHSRI